MSKFYIIPSYYTPPSHPLHQKEPDARYPYKSLKKMDQKCHHDNDLLPTSSPLFHHEENEPDAKWSVDSNTNTNTNTNK